MVPETLWEPVFNDHATGNVCFIKVLERKAVWYEVANADLLPVALLLQPQPCCWWVSREVDLDGRARIDDKGAVVGDHIVDGELIAETAAQCITVNN